MGQRVAFIDDCKGVLDSIYWTFKDTKFDIALFQNPVEALNQIEKEEFAAIVADQNMPELDGTTLLKRASKVCPDTIRIMMTAHTDSNTAIDAINQGHVYSFIPKPCEHEKLIEAVKKAIDIYETKTNIRNEQKENSEQNKNLVQLNQNLEKELYVSRKEIKESNETRRKLRERLRKAKKKESIGNALTCYVSLATLRMVEKSLLGIDYFGEKAEDVTVLFSDIRGFTKISEKSSPEEIYDLLNKCLSKMIEIIENHDGIIDKIIGDGIMAVFQGGRMSERALKCGESIINEFGENECANEIDKISVGVGVNTGPVYFGSIGSRARKNYTVVGNTVNIASRLCQAAKKDEVLFSETTLNTIRQRNLKFQSLGKKTFKNLVTPIKVFKVLP